MEQDPMLDFLPHLKAAVLRRPPGEVSHRVRYEWMPEGPTMGVLATAPDGASGWYMVSSVEMKMTACDHDAFADFIVEWATLKVLARGEKAEGAP